MPILSASPPSSLPPSGTAAGDLAGTYPNPALAAIGAAAGPVGNATTTPVVGIDAKGRVTSLAGATITGVVPGGAAGGDLQGTYPSPTLITPTYRCPGVSVYARGLLAENQPPVLNNAGTLPTQVAIYNLVTLFKGDIAKGLLFFVNTAGTSTAPTGIYVALYDSAGNRRAISNNLNSSSIWTVSGAYAVAAFNATYMIPADGAYFAAILEDGAFGGTALSLARSLSNSGIQNGAPALAGNFPLVYQQSGQTTLPDPASFAASTQSFFYCGVYY